MINIVSVIAMVLLVGTMINLVRFDWNWYMEDDDDLRPHS